MLVDSGTLDSLLNSLLRLYIASIFRFLIGVVLGLSGVVLDLGLLLCCGLMSFKSLRVLLDLAADSIVVL